MRGKPGRSFRHHAWIGFLLTRTFGFSKAFFKHFDDALLNLAGIKSEISNPGPDALNAVSFKLFCRWREILSHLLYVA